MGENISTVYVLLDGDKIIDINSDDFLESTDGWTPIDEGVGDKYKHAYLHYLPGRPCAEDGTTLWKLVDDVPVKRAQEELDADRLPAVKAVKEKELSNACNAAIVAGMDVETSRGTEHFSLQETDQINLTTAYNAILSGAASYPYHADGQLCRMFTAVEITAISNSSISHKLYHTTLCNHLLTWARRAETAAELEGITYSADALPEDLAANMTQVLADSATMTT